ncbi:Enoyl-CoA hydratase, mitochondrial [Folsomia candida]|uniref:Enoyl-CoA hydratase, mitochondrial n=1 Tax=Folsomia candida TaxID=158441 RepID=A0A226DG33_FOLCA|nr:Enoyl-CoA hydratase, mitochondrial [Folsomia candida]
MAGIMRRLVLSSLQTPSIFSAFRCLSTSNSLLREFVLTEKVGEKKNIGLITLNRPKALNALCDALMKDLSDAIDEFEKDKDIGTIILTGQGKAFAAGADIKEMQNKNFAEVFSGSFLSHWLRVSTCRKPVIAAVNGYALGGELDYSDQISPADG